MGLVYFVPLKLNFGEGEIYLSLDMVFSLLGGLGLFIYGMKQMGDGLQKSAGNKLKQLIGLLTTNRIAGLLVGTGVTAIIPVSYTHLTLPTIYSV